MVDPVIYFPHYTCISGQVVVNPVIDPVSTVQEQGESIAEVSKVDVRRERGKTRIRKQALAELVSRQKSSRKELAKSTAIGTGEIHTRVMTSISCEPERDITLDCALAFSVST